MGEEPLAWHCETRVTHPRPRRPSPNWELSAPMSSLKSAWMTTGPSRARTRLKKARANCASPAFRW
eukprot:10576045-Alexandrium_andersonii.AAC.1